MVPKTCPSTIKGRYERMILRTTWRRLHHRPLVMARRCTNEQRSSMPLEDHLIPRIGITNPAMIRPSKQGQRLGEKVLYIYPLVKPAKVIQTHILKKYCTVIILSLLVILTLALESCWQAPHQCSYLFLGLPCDQVNLWTVPTWTSLSADDPSIINFHWFLELQIIYKNWSQVKTTRLN